MTKFVMLKNVNMNSFCTILRNNRLSKGLKIKDLSIQLRLDQALISKYETGYRLPPEKHLEALNSILSPVDNHIRQAWLSEKIAQILIYEANPDKILELAESRIEYLQAETNMERISYHPDYSNELSTIDQLREVWIKKKPLNPTQLKKLKEYYNGKYTHESNQIEGNTLSFMETNLIINEGLTIAGKSMVEHLEAINHNEAIDYIYQLVQSNNDLSKRVLLEIHQLVLKSIDSDNAGRFRSVPVAIRGSRHIPPQPFIIDKLMEEYFLFYKHNKKKLHPIILAAEMHERLVSIHPFIDGNGRTSRLVMNLILLKHGYTITSLKGDPESRVNYFRTLEAVQMDSSPELFHRLIMNSVKASLEEHLAMV